MRFFARFFADESAATSIEYALMASGIAVAILAAVQGLGTAVTGNYTSINTALK
jgi:pilus assembly protein Flp/PilA